MLLFCRMRYIVLLLFQFTLIAQSPSITYINTDTTWSSDVSISGKVVVQDGATLNIEPGTVVKAAFSSDPNEATVLVIAKGGKINAVGTSAQPIVFTTEYDDLTAADVNNGTLVSSVGGATNDLTTRGMWGGIMVLGNANVGGRYGGGSDFIETLSEYDFATYGNINPVGNDNSGKLNYISIRHSGCISPNGDKIGGLTLGGVGYGTTINHIEIISNDDDAIELFGGSVDINHLLIFNQYDDAIDIDQAYSGTITNAYVAMGADSDNVIEADGSEDPFVTGSYTIDGVTAIQEFDNSEKLHQYGNWRSSATGINNNIVYKGFPNGTYIEGIETATFNAGTLTFSNLDFVTTDDLATINSVSRRTNSDELAELTSIHAEVVDIQKFNTGANEAEFVGWTAYNFSRNQFSCLFSVSGYLNQDLCEGETITPIEFELVNGSQIANITGLPSGVSYSISGNRVSISGTPSDDIGSTTEYSYTLSTTGCNQSTSNQILQGTITVNPMPKVIYSSGSTNQIVCEGYAITPIVFNLTDEAQTANVTGLPAGLSHSISGTTVTISGTPSGVRLNEIFEYTVEPISSNTGCAGTILGGTIIVYADGELTDTSSNRYQTINEGEAIEPINLTIAGGATGVSITDAAGDNIPWINVAVSGTSITITGTPSEDIDTTTEYAYTIETTGSSCNPATPIEGTITVYPSNGGNSQNINNGDILLNGDVRVTNENGLILKSAQDGKCYRIKIIDSSIQLEETSCN